MSKSYQSDSETQENHENPLFLPKRSSRYWKYYEKSNDEIATCRFCKSQIAYKSTVGNLGKHLMRMHEDQMEPADRTKSFVDNPDNRSSLLVFFDTHSESDTASCKACNKSVPDTYVKLSMHLNEHGKYDFDGKVEPTVLESNFKFFDPDDAKLDKKSSLLEFFDTNSEDKPRCKACNITVLDNYLKLTTHLNNHGKYDFDGKVDPSVLEKNNYFAVRKTHRNKRKSVAWSYFTVADKQRKSARCNLCKNLFAYMGSVSNLTKHLRRRHGDLELTAETEPGNQTSGTAEGTDDENQSLEPVWTFFRCIDKTLKIAKCVICKKRVTYSDDCPELKSHLRKHHPDVDLENEDNIGKTFMVTENGDFYEVDDQKREPLDIDDDSEDEAENIDYLDESALEDPINDVNPQKWEPQPKKHKIVIKRPKRESVTEIQTERNRLTEDDPIDHFGKYIATSLQKLPKQISNKLQLEFMKRIIEVQNVDIK